MGKEKTEFEEKFVSKTEKTKKLWEKRISPLRVTNTDVPSVM